MPEVKLCICHMITISTAAKKIYKNPTYEAYIDQQNKTSIKL